tara:strand:+ start:248 stop:502 length:255 start_codon:yes stop_codon:yes gene_type:complete
MEGISIEEIRGALSQLPEELQKELLDNKAPIDTIGIKMELVKFVSELHKHNQGVDWETNKVKPQKISIETIIEGSQRLFDFLTE